MAADDDRRRGQAAGDDVDGQLDLGHRPELQPAAALEGDGGEHRAEGERSPAARPRPAAAPGVPRTRGGQPKRRARTRLQSHQPPTPRAVAASRPMSAISGVGTSRPELDSCAEPEGAGLHELAAHVDRLGRTCRPGRAPCAARAWRWPAGRRCSPARRSTSPRSRGRRSPSRPRSRRPRRCRWRATAAVVGGLWRLPAPRAARRPRWSTSRQPVYSSESVGSCVERLLVLRLRVGAVDVLVAAGVAQQLVHAAFGAGGRGHGQAEDDQGCQQSAHGAVATGRRSGDLPAGLPLRG